MLYFVYNFSYFWLENFDYESHCTRSLNFLLNEVVSKIKKKKKKRKKEVAFIASPTKGFYFGTVGFQTFYLRSCMHSAHLDTVNQAMNICYLLQVWSCKYATCCKSLSQA